MTEGPSNLKSMTGFGRAQTATPEGVFTVELRCVNNRFLDSSVMLPRKLSTHEGAVREMLRARISRGKLECRVRFAPAEAARPEVKINQELAAEYATQLQGLADLTGEGTVPLKVLISLPGVLEVGGIESDEESLWPWLLAAVTEALANFEAERRREGEALGKALSELGARLATLREQAEEIKDEVVMRFRARLAARIAELEEGTTARLEPGRLELEIAMYAEKCDINEELVRLGAHLERYAQLIANAKGEPVGKNFDFLLQEIGREVNTIGSKSRETQLTGLALEMKNIAEQIREQIQNIE